MLNKKMKAILLIRELGKNLITRNSLQTIFNKIEKSKEKEITIDFKGVEFISRSSTDEYLKFKEETKKNLTEINQTNDVKKMFETVTKSREYTYSEEERIATPTRYAVYTLTN